MENLVSFKYLLLSPTTARDLSLAYSPGVAIPCLEIEKNPDAAYDYTAKGNMVLLFLMVQQYRFR